MKFLTIMISWLLLLAFLCAKSIDGHKLRYVLFTAGPTGHHGHGYFDSSGAVPAIELAEEMINANSSILPGYNLTHTAVFDTMCDRTISLNKYFDAISSRRPAILGLLGCGCSVASEPVAEIIHYNSISQISYASPSIELSDRQRFPNFFRAYPSDADLPAAKVALVQKYGWRRVALITQKESLLAETVQMLTVAFTELGIETKNRMGSSEKLWQDLNDSNVDFFFEKEDFRVFFLNTDSKTARRIICEAYLRGFTYPKYAWFTNGWYQSNWWTEEVNPEPIDCSDDQLAQFLHRSLALEKVTENNDLNAPTDVGLTPKNFDNLYQQKLTKEQRNKSNLFLARVAYDALWSFALALNKTNEILQSLKGKERLRMTLCEESDKETDNMRKVVPLESFTYSDKFIGCIVRRSLEHTNFIGVSGHVSFDDTGSRVQSQVGVYQYQLVDNSINRLAIADIQHVNDTLSVFAYKDNQSNRTVYPNSEGGVPPDGTPVSVVITFHLALVGTYHVLATAGLVFTTICLVFNFTQRKKKVIRLNSPNLNYFVILGSYVMYIAIFFRVLPSTDLRINAVRCTLATPLNIIGYCLAYGAILAKMGRIHYIFRNPVASKKTLKDWHLVLAALAITAVGAVLVVLQIAVPVFQLKPYLAPNEEPPSIKMNELGVEVKEMGVFCVDSSQYPLSNAWLILIFIYLALLQLIGIILALRTRKVKVKALRDSRYIVAAILSSTIGLIMIAVTTIAAGFLINVVEILISGSMIIVTMEFLSLLFIPKMVSLYKDPKGECILESTNHRNNLSVSRVFPAKISTGLHTEDQIACRATELQSKLLKTLRAKNSTESDHDECVASKTETSAVAGDQRTDKETTIMQQDKRADGVTIPHCRHGDYENGPSSGDDLKVACSHQNLMQQHSFLGVSSPHSL